MEILFKNVDFIVLNKPSGIVMYEPKSADIVRQEVFGVPTVANFVRKAFPETQTVGDLPGERPGMVHRLDKETSGVLVVARTQAFFDYLKEEFAERRVKKEYLTLVYGILREPRVISRSIGIVSGSVRRSTKARNMRMIKPAVTDIVPLAVKEDEPKATLVRVMPRTGRTHQIRVHLASVGLPVVGDKLYGPKEQRIPVSRQFLHAYRISFRSRSGEMFSFSAPLPDELSAMLKSLGLSGGVI